jgi:type IV secretion system protein VirD4
MCPYGSGGRAAAAVLSWLSLNLPHDAILFLGGSERTTLEDLSKLLGRETIDSYSNSISHGNSPSYGQNFQKLGKELMAIDELAVLDGGKCILQLRGVRPFLSAKYNLKNHKNYKMLAEYSDKNKFDIREYLKTDLKIGQDDIFDAYEIMEVID